MTPTHHLLAVSAEVDGAGGVAEAPEVAPLKVDHETVVLLGHPALELIHRIAERIGAGDVLRPFVRWRADSGFMPGAGAVRVILNNRRTLGTKERPT